MIISIDIHINNTNIEVQFNHLNGEWFVSTFPSVLDIQKLKEFYIGKDFYEVKKKYNGKILRESGMDV